MPGSARRDDNHEVALIAQNLLGTQPLFITGLSLTNATPLHVAMVDGNGDQIVSFGGGTQYTDAGVPPAHPVGNTIEWSDGSNWQTVSTAKPLPVSGSFSLTNPTIGGAVPATANYIAGNKAGNLTGLLFGSQTTANSLAVALASDQVAIPVTGTFWQTTQPVSIATAPVLVAGSAIIGKVGIDQTTPGTTNKVSIGTDGTVAATQSGTWTVQPGNTANTTAWKVDGSAVTQPVSLASVPSHAVTNAGTFAVQATEADGANTTLGAKADAKSTATDTTAISVMSVLKQISASVQAPPSQAVTNAGTFAVQAAESDGANVTLGAKADAKSTATDTTAVSAMSVLKQISASVQAPPSQAVTNAGTFATQATLAAETTKIIGTVNIAASQSITTVDSSATSATVAQVASSATNVTLKTSNASRKMLIIVNDSTQILYVKLGATASTTSYAYKLAAGDTLELPHPIYTGIVDGIWASANGNAYVTEY